MTPLALPAAGNSCRSKVSLCLKHPVFIATIYIVATIILYIQAITTDRYNNFIIFRSSFYHLVHKLPLYQVYSAEYFDYFLYHPSFPVLFAPFALLPKELGLLAWLLASTLIFLYMVRQLPFTDNIKYIISWFLLIELSNAIQSEQTNPAMAAFMVLTVTSLQRQQQGRAAFFTALCFFIKGYGAITGLAFLFFPRKGSFIGWGLVWFIAGSLLPLLFISPQLLCQHYIDWFHLLTSSTIKEDGSLLGMLHVILGLHAPASELFDKIALLIAVVMLLHVLISGLVKRVQGFPLMLTAYLLIWIVVFNQSTESPTYIMAVTGVAIGCFAMPLPGTWRKCLLWFTLVIVSLSPTDLVPKFINQYAIALHIKALPCTIVLLFLQACIGGWGNTTVNIYKK
ncbi:glycosyltransferase family 87 protein [Chitinophaga sancti]|uniref:Glycosyltransferase family 87 protein n=1 Tax=Chitinophaga sancti TaxID=1004 RepID=A0A1K1SKU7_9BACT|nr:glycosyltransferase family 87 protein [Chitinophaga sancti]WQD65488.1 glycosyltransferase family 87 protein [Chitinophaga sancti]WQG88889.1 glycosyltransferase family 87 protein [Chitinophaga sancti]SFW84804.1 Protein of unknown function [Chitinophaga sancti]